MYRDQDCLGDPKCLKVMADTAMKINARLELVQKLDIQDNPDDHVVRRSGEVVGGTDACPDPKAS